MILVKCFETRHMPDEVFGPISELLTDDRGWVTEDRGIYRVNRQGKDDVIYDWLIANGAEDGEKVLIERGVWT